MGILWYMVAKDRGSLNAVANNSKIHMEDFTLVAICRWSLILGGHSDRFDCMFVEWQFFISPLT